MMETKQCRLPSNDRDVLSANNPEAGSEDKSTDRESKCLDVLKHKQNTTQHLCWVCGKHLKSAKNLKVHLQTHSKDYCKDWKESEATDSDGDGNNDETKEGPSQDKTKIRTLNNLCWVCGKFLNSVKSLRMHLQTQHKDSYKDLKEIEGTDSDEDSDQDETKPKFQPSDNLCWFCGKFFSSAEMLMEHLQMHNEENGCKN